MPDLFGCAICLRPRARPIPRRRRFELLNARTLVVVALCSSPRSSRLAADPFFDPGLGVHLRCFLMRHRRPVHGHRKHGDHPFRCWQRDCYVHRRERDLHLTNTSSQVTIGRFDVVAPPDYIWPVCLDQPRPLDLPLHAGGGESAELSSSGKAVLGVRSRRRCRADAAGLVGLRPDA